MNKKKNLKIFIVTVSIIILLSNFSALGIQTKKIIQIDPSKKIDPRPYDGQLRVYIVEPVSRWNDYDGNPYHFGFLDFAMDETLSIGYLETYDKQMTWDAHTVGYDSIQNDNIMVIAAVFNPAIFKKYSYPPSKNPFDAHYVDAAAAAKPGEIGFNFKNETFTHTIFCEEATATWCHYCPASSVALMTVYDTYNFPFYFVAMIADKVPITYSYLKNKYNLYGYPTCYFDGGYKIAVGSTTANSCKNNVISSGKRNSHDLNLSLSLEWIGNGIIDIGVEITSNEEMPNIAPLNPEIIGPASGRIKKEIEYKITTTDPDNDDVYYIIDWDENISEVTIGPYTSGEEVMISHIWQKEGNYTIKIKAKDLENHESEYSTLDLTIPKVKPRYYLLLGNYLRIINLSKILFRV